MKSILTFFLALQVALFTGFQLPAETQHDANMQQISQMQSCACDSSCEVSTACCIATFVSCSVIKSSINELPVVYPTRLAFFDYQHQVTLAHQQPLIRPPIV